MNKEQEKMLNLLLQQLKETETAIDVIISTKFERETTENLNSKIEKKESILKKEARRYGQKEEIIEPILQEYRSSLEEVQNEYSDEKNLWLIQKGNVEKDEMQLIIETQQLKKQLAQMMDLFKQSLSSEVLKGKIEKCKENLSDKKEKIKIVRKASEEAVQNVDECKNKCNSSINDLTGEKYLVELDLKDNILKKIFGKITDKLGGKLKFNQNVEEPLKMQIANIKEKTTEHYIPEKMESLMELAKEGAKQIIFKNAGLKGITIMALVEVVSLVKDGVKIANEISS